MLEGDGFLKRTKLVTYLFVILFAAIALTSCGSSNVVGRWEVVPERSDNRAASVIDLRSGGSGTMTSGRWAMDIQWQVNRGSLSITESALGMSLTTVYDFEINGRYLMLTSNEQNFTGVFRRVD